jgi:hypothetical protein
MTSECWVCGLLPDSVEIMTSECWVCGLLPDSVENLPLQAIPLNTYEILMWAKAVHLTDWNIDWVRNKVFNMRRFDFANSTSLPKQPITMAYSPICITANGNGPHLAVSHCNLSFDNNLTLPLLLSNGTFQPDMSLGIY